MRSFVSMPNSLANRCTLVLPISLTPDFDTAISESIVPWQRDSLHREKHGNNFSALQKPANNFHFVVNPRRARDLRPGSIYSHQPKLHGSTALEDRASRSRYRYAATDGAS